MTRIQLEEKLAAFKKKLVRSKQTNRRLIALVQSLHDRNDMMQIHCANCPHYDESLFAGALAPLPPKEEKKEEEDEG